MKHYCSIIFEVDTPEIVYSKNENPADVSTHKSLFSSDGVYANDNGHQVVADKIFTKIEYGM